MAHQHKIGYLVPLSVKRLTNVYKYSYKNRLLKPRFIANIKEVQQRLHASIKMGIFDKSNYIVNTGIIEQFCPKWRLEKRVHQLKVERGISFPDARKAALSEQSTNTSSKRTAASVVSGSTTATTPRSQKSTISIAIQTELTWPQGADTPVPVKTNSQTTQTDINQNSAENTEIPPLLLLHQEVTEVQMLQYHLPVKAVRGTLNPTVLFIFEKERQTKNKPPPSTHR